MVLAAVAISNGVGELNFAIPIFGWCEGPAVISVGAERAIAFTDFQVSDGECIAINVRAIFEQLFFSDTDAAVFIDGTQINRARNDGCIINGL